MIKNIIRTLFLVLSMLCFSIGYSQNYVGSSRFNDNWFIGLSGGVSTNLHTWTAPQGGHFSVELGRHITPIWGFRGQVTAGVNDLQNWQGHASHVHNGTVVDNLQAYLLGTFNFSNALFGYTGVPRTFEVSAVAGVGYGHGFDSKDNVQSTDVLFKDALLTKAGLDLDFNVGKSKAWTISLRPSVVFNTTGHGQYCSSHAVFQADAAVVYKFKNSNNKHYFDRAVLRDEAELMLKNDLISTLNKENIELKNENEVLKQKLEKPVKVDTIVVGNENPYTQSVTFKQNSAKITNEECVAALAEQIKSIGKKVNILGYASTEGTEEFNNKLSEQRAMAVKQALSKYDVKNLLGKAVGMGATDKFSTTNLELNRVVVVAE